MQFVERGEIMEIVSERELPEDSEGNHYYRRSSTARQFIQFEKTFYPPRGIWREVHVQDIDRRSPPVQAGKPVFRGPYTPKHGCESIH